MTLARVSTGVWAAYWFFFLLNGGLHVASDAKFSAWIFSSSGNPIWPSDRKTIISHRNSNGRTRPQHSSEFIFDKADAVAQLEELKERRESLCEEIAGLETQVKTKGETIGPWIERRITRIREEEERLGSLIQKAEQAKIE